MQGARRTIDAVAASDLCAMQTCGVRHRGISDLRLGWREVRKVPMQTCCGVTYVLSLVRREQLLHMAPAFAVGYSLS
jgi:hypothetical protein